MKQKYFKSNVAIAMLLVVLIFQVSNTNAQIWKKIKEGAKGIQDAARQVTSTTLEVNNTVKTVKQSWKKDTSSNIRYQQIPDYRTREEVSINKKQKLSVENGQFVNLSWEPVTKFDNQIFPSFVIGWASYKGVKDEDMGSSLGFNINTTLPNVVLKWEIESADKSYFTIDSGYINCNDIRSTKLFMPKIAWNYRALAKHPTSAPLNIYFRLIDPNTGGKVEKLVNVNLRSINDCLTYFNGKSYQFLFTTFINEDHPEIDKILKQMLDTKIIDAVLGYQWGPSYVDLQVAALWRILHDRGFQYSSITNNSGYNESKGLFSQTVRTFDNSLKTNQANCVDGTVVFASVLKRMGIRPIMITVPGHCFLGYYADDTTTSNIRFLETTMLSDKTFLTNAKASVQKYNDVLAKAIPKGVKLSDFNKAYFLEFLNAQLEGYNKYKSNMEKYGAKYVTLLDVSDLRKYVKPIPLYE
ncbi:MAG TPA: hypothetical protein VMY77_00030 [Chitinophagaceae bacterium]|nr:hypothetical protein [Chitinophagaceae bacterium]